MPGASRTVDKKHLTINIKSIVNCHPFGKLRMTLSLSKGQLSIVQGKSFGFTLIELLVVITLFGITSTLVTASYLTFERNQRIRNAAQTLKNDLRFAQNKALAGDKGAGSECPVASTLVGWYVTFDTAQTSRYSYAGVCNTGGTESRFSPKTVTYPSGVTLNNAAPNTGIKIGGSPRSGIVTVLFKPLSTDVALHYSDLPPFNSGNSISFTGDLVIELKGQQTSNLNTVTVRSTGEISGN